MIVDQKSEMPDQEYTGEGKFTNPVPRGQNISTDTYDNYSSPRDQGDGGVLIGDDNRKFTVALRVSVDKNGTVALIFAASLIVLISAARSCYGVENCEHDDGSIDYALAVGVVSMIISGLLMVATKYKPGLVTNYSHYASIFLLLWWGIGASFMTFKHPFPGVGNGYFASWLGFAMSGGFASQTVDAVANRKSSMQPAALDRAIVFLIFSASVVVIIAGSVICDARDSCDNDFAFAVSSGVLSACVCLIYLLAQGAVPIQMAAGFLGAWWFVSTGVLTFDEGDPFGTVGNGYFAVWGCFLSSFYFVYHVFVGGMSASD